MEGIVKEYEIKLEIEKLNEVKQGVLSFITSSKRSIVDYIIYRNLLIIATDDSWIIIYNLSDKSVKFEIKSLYESNTKIISLKLLLETEDYNYNDSIVCLCNNYSFLIIDLASYSITKTFDFKNDYRLLNINYSKKLTFILLSENSAMIILINKNFDFIPLYEILTEDIEVTVLKENNYLYDRNFLLLQNKQKLLIYKLKMFEDSNEILNFQINENFDDTCFYFKNLKEYLLNQNENTDNEIMKLYSKFISNSNIDKQSLSNLNNVKNDKNLNIQNNNFKPFHKFISISKNDSIYLKNDKSLIKGNEIKNNILSFAYSYITDQIYIVNYNSIIIFSNNLNDFISEDLKIIGNITKSYQISDIKIANYFVVFVCQNKLFVNSIFNPEITLENVDFNRTLIGKEIDLISYSKQNRIIFDENLIFHIDSLYMSRVADNKTNNLFSSTNILFSSYSNGVLDILHIGNLTTNIEGFKKSDFSHYKSLTSFFYNHYNVYFKKYFLINNITKWLSSNNKEININDNIYNGKQKYFTILRDNLFFFRNKCLEIYFDTILDKNYENAFSFLDKCNLDFFFTVMIFKNIVYSQLIKNIIENYFNILSIDQTKYSKYFMNYDLNNKQEESRLISIISIMKEVINRLILYRNEIKKLIPKNTRSKINIELIIQSEKSEEIIEDFKLLCLNNFNKNKEMIFKRFNQYDVFDIRILCIKYLSIENIIFMMNIHLSGNIKSKKIRNNLRLIVKQSNKLLDIDYLKLMFDYGLKEEIILFYYYRKMYVETLNTIKKFYDEESFVNCDIEEIIDENNIYEDDSILCADVKYNKLNKWIVVYVNTICKIPESSLQSIEIYELLKWPLSINHNLCFKVLLKRKFKELSVFNKNFYNFLKTLSIDSVLTYFEIFINDVNVNLYEIVDLYLLKLTLLHKEFNSIKEKANKNILNDYLNSRKKLVNLIISYNENSKINEKESINRENSCTFSFYEEVEKKINDIMLSSVLNKEIAVCNIKKNNIELGINMLFENVENEEDLFTYSLFQLFAHCPNFEFILNVLNRLKLFKKEFQRYVIDEMFQILTTNNNFFLIKAILELFDLNHIWTSEEYIDFSISLFSNIEKYSNTQKIELSLSETKLLRLFEELYDMEKESLNTDNISFCKICKNGITDLKFFYYEENYYHIKCYNQCRS